LFFFVYKNLIDYFLRASKLGIQTNILYSHNKNHPSIIDTAIAGEILLPANCRFLWSDMKNAKLLVNGEKIFESYLQ
jgi:hypothetical protein